MKKRYITSLAIGLIGLQTLGVSASQAAEYKIGYTSPIFQSTLVYRPLDPLVKRTSDQLIGGGVPRQEESSEVTEFESALDVKEDVEEQTEEREGVEETESEEVAVEEEEEKEKTEHEERDTAERLREIEEQIQEREGTQSANPESQRPDNEEIQTPSHHPDVVSETSSNTSGSGLELLDFTPQASSIAILDHGVDTRTVEVKDWATNPENEGLQPHVARFKEEVAALFGITQFSLYRPGDPQDHGKGLAIDFMVPVGSDVGNKIASYTLDRMYDGSEKISYVIWEQHIWGDWSSGWEAMEDRGSITQNHYDHVHVSFHP